MKIWSITNGVEREAYRVDGIAYKCFPKSSNLKKDSKAFGSIQEAASFLIQNKGWGIRMNPESAIIYNGLNICLDE